MEIVFQSQFFELCVPAWVVITELILRSAARVGHFWPLTSPLWCCRLENFCLGRTMVAKENNGSIVCRWRNYYQVVARWLGLFTKKVTLIRWPGPWLIPDWWALKTTLRNWGKGSGELGSGGAGGWKGRGRVESFTAGRVGDIRHGLPTTLQIFLLCLQFVSSNVLNFAWPRLFTPHIVDLSNVSNVCLAPAVVSHECRKMLES